MSNKIALEALTDAKRAINSMKVEAETAGAGGDQEMLQDACEQISNEGLAADTAIRAAIAALEAMEAGGDTLADNVMYLLNQCPYAVRDYSGDRTGSRAKEDIAGSLSITFLGMQHRLAAIAKD